MNPQPFLQNFKSAEPPEIPECGSIENAGNGNDWQTANVTTNGFSGNVLQYTYNSDNPADAWYFTRGISLTTGVNYQISYLYGNVRADYSEKLRVSSGPKNNAASMTTELINYDDINSAEATNGAATFSVTTDGIYYFGFNAYSDANQFNLFVDDILCRRQPLALSR